MKIVFLGNIAGPILILVVVVVVVVAVTIVVVSSSMSPSMQKILLSLLQHILWKANVSSYRSCVPHGLFQLLNLHWIQELEPSTPSFGVVVVVMVVVVIDGTAESIRQSSLLSSCLVVGDDDDTIIGFKGDFHPTLEGIGNQMVTQQFLQQGM